MAFSLKDYRITGEIGRGGFATVYRASQKSLTREVAIKCLSPQRIQNEGDIVRFRREAEAMASLTHDNILSVYDYAYFNGSYYIVMEYVDGPALDKALERGMSKHCALSVLEKVAGALSYAHSENIIHRDIKPANILLGRNGRVKLADFGLALFQAGIESYSSPAPVLGTISYMAPEALVSPRDVDARIDIFSLGCLLYRVSSGNLPFCGDSFGEISFHLLNDEPAPLAETGNFKPLAAITMRCLQKDRDTRPSIVEIHRALKEALRDRYHAANEEMVSFVKTLSQDPPPAIQQQADPIPDARLTGRPKKKRTASLAVAAGAILCLSGIALFLYFHPVLSGKRSATTPLPVLPQIGQTVAMSGAAENPLSKNAAGEIRTDGPAPLSGSTPGMDIARLVVRGLLPGDTVFIDGGRQPHDSSIQLTPGRYHLDIRRKSGPSVVRVLELLPYERQVVDLQKEGTSNGRSHPQ